MKMNDESEGGQRDENEFFLSHSSVLVRKDEDGDQKK